MQPTNKLYFVRLHSLADLCRISCEVDEPSVVYASQAANNWRLFCFGEKLASAQIVYYANIDRPSRFINYSLEDGEKENVSLSEQADFVVPSQTRCSINVVNIDISKMSSCKNIKVNKVRVGSLLDLAKLVVKQSAKDEAVPKMYFYLDADSTKGIATFGAFNLIDELNDDTDYFYFALGEYTQGAFLRYDYKADSTSFSNSVEDHSYFYIKLVRLAEPFVFAGKKAKQNKKQTNKIEKE